MVTGVTIVRGWFDYLLLSDSLINSDVLFSEGSPQLSLKLPPRGGCGTSCILNDHAVERGGMKVVKHFGGSYKGHGCCENGNFRGKTTNARVFFPASNKGHIFQYDGFILWGIMVVVTTKALFLGGSGIGLCGRWLSISFCNLDDHFPNPQSVATR